MALRLAFMGTPDFAVPSLLELSRHHEVVAVYTRAPKPAGRRGLELVASAVDRAARARTIAVKTPTTLRDPQIQAEFASLDLDVAVVVAYGLILPSPILTAPRHGCYNVHASLLPRWRGAAPINRSIMAGDVESGVTIIKMDENLDTGPMAMSKGVPIPSDMTAGQLHDALAQLGAELIVQSLAALERNELRLEPQPQSGVTYAKKIEKSEARIDWSKPWHDVHNLIRGLSPAPGAWCEWPSVGRVKVLRSTAAEGSGSPGEVLDERLTVACGTGAVRILELQRAGGRSMSAAEFLRGDSVKPGTAIN